MFFRIGFKEKETFRVGFNEVHVVEIAGEGSELYTGDYEVAPSAAGDVSLPTADKLMLRDVIVKKIPYYETSNNAGGTTIYIASEE